MRVIPRSEHFSRTLSAVTTPVPPSSGFKELGVREDFLKILGLRGVRIPTPIQHQAIPIAMQGKDVIGIAQTGTGKTLAFGLPMLQQLAEKGGHGLILVPTRELAQQVEHSLEPFARLLHMRTAVLIGGASMHLQKEAIRRGPSIVVATPGRLNDHLQQRTITLKTVKVLVLDEADQMLDMGFKPQVEQILQHVPKQRQTMLFSATMPVGIVDLAQRHMELPLRIEVAPAGTTVQSVEQELFIVAKEQKLTLLQSRLHEYKGPVLVFSRTKHGATKMTRVLKANGFSASEIHSNKSLSQRREALEGFRSGKYRVLVATDIAARGIHVTGIELVVNFDSPQDPEDYVPRIGRTGRAGRQGKAVSFAEPSQATGIRSIERLIRKPISRKALPANMPVPVMPAPTPHAPRRGGFHHPRRSGPPSRSGSSSRGGYRGRGGRR